MSKKKQKKTKDLIVVSPEFTSFDVVDNYIEETTRQATEDKWDRDDTARYHDIREIKIAKDKYSDMTAPFKIDPKETYFLLSVIYSTGDSFGRDDGRIEYIELYSDESLAKQNADEIEKHYTNHKDSYHNRNKVELMITNQAGKKYAYYCSWIGYFDFLQEARVDAVTIKSEE